MSGRGEGLDTDIFGADSCCLDNGIHLLPHGQFHPLQAAPRYARKQFVMTGHEPHCHAGAAPRFNGGYAHRQDIQSSDTARFFSGQDLILGRNTQPHSLTQSAKITRHH